MPAKFFGGTFSALKKESVATPDKKDNTFYLLRKDVKMA